MPNEELKTCPFCGGKATRHYGTNAHPNKRIICKKCGSQTSIYGVLKDAIVAWNKRVTEVKE